jgi:hypothetical protein
MVQSLIVRHDPGLAASPHPRYTLEVRGDVVAPFFFARVERPSAAISASPSEVRQ